MDDPIIFKAINARNRAYETEQKPDWKEDWMNK